MSQNKILSHLSYFSLFLVLSFFLFNNIFLVLIGICIALYEINKVKLYKIIKLIKNNEIELDNLNESGSVYVDRELNDKTIKLELVEIVEEFGYIPSEH